MTNKKMHGKRIGHDLIILEIYTSFLVYDFRKALMTGLVCPQICKHYNYYDLTVLETTVLVVYKL